MELEFGEIIGIDFYDVVSYSCNNYCKNKGDRSFIFDNVYCGVKWQCVEFVRRWLLIVFNISFEEIDMAYMIFKKSKIKFKNILTNQILQYSKNHNSQSHNKLPKIGTIIVWDRTDNYETGHVAIVSKVTHDYIYISEQNWDNILWNNQYSRKIRINYLPNNSIFLNDVNEFGLSILGWINIEN